MSQEHVSFLVNVESYIRIDPSFTLLDLRGGRGDSTQFCIGTWYRSESPIYTNLCTSIYTNFSKYSYLPILVYQINSFRRHGSPGPCLPVHNLVNQEWSLYIREHRETRTRGASALLSFKYMTRNCNWLVWTNRCSLIYCSLEYNVIC